MNKYQEHIERFTSNLDLSYIASALGFCALILIGVLWHMARVSGYDQQYIAFSENIRLLSQSIPKAASQAISGDARAFEKLKLDMQEFDEYISILKTGYAGEDQAVTIKDSSVNRPSYFPQSPMSIKEKELSTLEKLWVPIRQNVNVIINNENDLLLLHQYSADISNSVPTLIKLYQKIIDQMVSEEQPAKLIELSTYQLFRLERVQLSLHKILHGEVARSENTQLIDVFMQDFKVDFDSVRKALGSLEKSLNDSQSGITNRTQNILREISEVYQRVLPKVDYVVKLSNSVTKNNQASDLIAKRSDELLKASTMLTKAYRIASDGRLYSWAGIGLWIALLAIIGCIGLLFYRVQTATRFIESNLLMTEAQNKAHEISIQKLIDEIQNLADGDLTVHATVGKGITSTIAESINFALDALRKLIATINETATEVSMAAQGVVNTGKKLAEASEGQAQKIVGVTASVNAMAASIEHVSSNAAKSTSVAENSVGIANKGVTVVADMIMGMGQIRQQIQETAKQIKRLGERSQEIGDMVSLIDDIADQTNILSLNAAIQAAMAGEAGRGFAVVADEVQRLAERSSHATREIEGLVKNIQHDTNQAVVSMEQTTAEVVQGARLAEDAGVALEQIETVSRELADLIQSISNEAQQQAETSGKISKSMDVIQNIAVQTASGTSDTANSIGRLAELVISLRNSVAGFTLSKSNYGKK